MKLIINGSIKPENIDGYLNNAKQKADKIDAFCKENNIDELYYRDSEMEYEFKKKESAKNARTGGVKNGKGET